MAGADVGIDPRAQDVLLRFDLIGNELSAWAWREGDPMPAEPQVTTVHSELTTGEVIVAADLGSRLSNNKAIFRYVEVYEPAPPTPDFNGDEIVDIKDLILLIEHWGLHEPSLDIAPLPFGDGIVDIQDLEVLMSFWQQEILPVSLLAYWRLDETESGIAYDRVGDNNGTLFGNRTWQPSGGKIRGALDFDGIDDYISTDPVLNPTDGPFSVIAWVNGGAPGQVVVSQQGATNLLMADAEGSLTTELKGPGRDSVPLHSKTNITDGNWHRIALVWDGFSRTLYVDSVAVAQDTQDSLRGSVSGLYIGCGKAMEPGSFWSGLIDDVRIYNRAVIP